MYAHTDCNSGEGDEMYDHVFSLFHVQGSQNTPLTISSDRGHSEVVRVLLEGGANINHQTKV